MKPLIFLLLILPAVCQAKPRINKDSASVQWIRSHALRVKTVDAGNGFEDLMSLKDILKNREIIGLGEATHGTSEFFRMKHRMLEFLVKEMGYRAFAIEANMPECLAVNEYVLHGKGNVHEVVAGMHFWTWRTKEVVNMVEWMRKYNSDKPENEKVKFYGFDMQYTSVILNSLDSVFKNSHTPEGLHLRKLLDSITSELGLRRIPEIDLKKGNKWISILDSLNNDQRYKRIYEKQSRVDTVFLERYTTLLRDYIRMYESMNLSSFPSDIRDSFMAENIKWLHTLPGCEKMVLWAHNYHVSTRINPFRSKDSTMGSYLRKIFGSKYYVIGFDFYKGSFQSKGPDYQVDTFNLTSQPEYFTGSLFNNTGLPLFFLNLHQDSNDSASFLNTNLNSKDIGAVYIPRYARNGYFFTHKVSETYDGIIFISHTTASKADTFSTYASLSTTIDAIPYRKKEIRVSCSIRLFKDTIDAEGNLIFYVLKRNGKSSEAPRLQIVKSGSWKNVEITSRVPRDAKELVFSIYLRDKSAMIADDFKVWVKSRDQWIEAENISTGFEDGIVGEVPGKFVFKGQDQYNILITDSYQCSGKKCVFIGRK